MAYFSKFKIGNTSYDVKDAAAGKTLAINGTTLQLKNAAGTVVSSVTLPAGGGGAKVFFAYFSAAAEAYSWNNTSITCTDLYDGEGNQASWVDVTDDSIVYGIFACGSNPYDLDVYIAPLTQDNATAAPNLRAFRAIVMGDTNNDVVPAKLGFFYGEYNTQAEQWVTGPTGTAQALGGGGGPVVYDVYDGSGQAMISTSNIMSSGNVILINGSTAVHASDIDPTGSYILNFTDCAIAVNNIESYNKAMNLNGLVQGNAFKVRFVNQWGDNWDYVKYN